LVGASHSKNYPKTLKRTPKTPIFCLTTLRQPWGSSKNCLELGGGGRALFIGKAARLARHHRARRVMVPCEACSLPRGNLIRHVAPPPNPPRFSCVYPFLTRFSGVILEAFWYSKWVMQHIAGKLLTSTFQR
jgi:hypothetical protein